MLVVSGVGAKGTSYITLSGGEGLGPDGAQRLADLLRNASPPLLVSLGLRHHTHHPSPRTPSVSRIHIGSEVG